MVLKPRQYFGIEQQKFGTAQRVNVTAPVGGLNTRDSYNFMDPKDAIVMKNFFPYPNYVGTRKGYVKYTSALSGNVETLVQYNVGTTKKFLCANSDEINDITNPDGVVLLKSGFSSARWQTALFNNYIMLFNGADTPQLYDGASLTDSTINGVGLDPTKLDGVNIFKNRAFVWDSTTQDFWYGATNAIQGEFTKFPLGGVASFGGNIIGMETWNLDGGDGVDDYALFLMSNGSAILYQGSDPGDINSWSLIGTYQIGRPKSKRSMMKIAGDVAIITEQDLVFFSQVFKNDGVITSQSKLSGGINEDNLLYGNNYGWEIALYQKNGWLILNIPIITNSKYKQYVINTITGAGAEFENINARTFGLFDGNLYFGGNGVVYLADQGYTDDGGFIPCDIQTAYTNLGTQQEKVINAVRNTLSTDPNTAYSTTINFDYQQSTTPQDIFSQAVGGEWDTFLWDTTPWADEKGIRTDLIITSGQGVDISTRLKSNLKSQSIEWYRIDYSITLSNIL